MRITLALTFLGSLLVGLWLIGWARTGDEITTYAQNSTMASVTRTCTLKVSGMVCEGCAAAVKIAAKKAIGVVDAKVSYDQGLAEITYDATTVTPEAIARVISEHSGLAAEVVTNNEP